LKRKSVADVVGALFFIAIVFLSMFSIMLIEGYYFASSDVYHHAVEYQSQFNKENLTVSYVEALPPSGKSGIVVFNYGIPVTIEDVIIESNGSLTFSRVNEQLATGQSIDFPTGTKYSGVLTNYGAFYMANVTTQMVPVSTIGLGVSLSKPGGVYFVPSGSTDWIVYSQRSARWYVNGSDWGAGRYIVIPQIDGPTTITAIRVPGIG
jgi:hypothetical protein